MHIYMQGAALISDEMWRRLRGGVCVWAQSTHTHRNARNVLLAWGITRNAWEFVGVEVQLSPPWELLDKSYPKAAAPVEA